VRPPLASAYKWMRISKLLLPLFMFLKTSRRDFSSIQGAYAAMTKGSCAKGHRSALPISSFPTVPILSFSTSFGLSRNKQLPLTSEDKRVSLFSGDAGLQPEPLSSPKCATGMVTSFHRGPGTRMIWLLPDSPLPS